mmetsp:Transcript_31221/g.87555  ORF Transcript_31221/g.87555 Transcript_31221/m.87555 type:complete len:323 (-) Transcript_31221:47-1015(-)|eukprot:CAMPEP_0119123494 /NCGR_PEP_ID=MMETSP1310-20130426/3428_1 /TAXON_ID=464262 /ORGANISM="Genus nov. species nov., Strain RCC2339" /LENGTH=322 /DNA_ID=CAMNT_0007113329 /DNA_START=119 /DNA_END=1087 /DNA_ORIENTATION=+
MPKRKRVEEVEDEDGVSDGEGSEEVEGEGEGNEEDFTQEDLLELRALYDTKEGDRRPCIHNSSRMDEKCEELQLGREQGIKELPWIEAQVVPCDMWVGRDLGGKAEDDFSRESAIVKQGLDAATKAWAMFKELDIPHIRPDDYFAEHVKSGDHMDKVRRKLLADKTKIEAAEERRRVREMKKFGKQAQKEKQKERQQQKKQALDVVKQWRKDGQGDDMDDSQYLSSLEKKQANAPKGSGKQGTPARRNTKRDAKNEKYGYGGPKKRAKKNTADSAADMSGFSVNKNRSVSSDLVSKLPKRKQNQLASRKKRPGKSKRRQGKH